MQSGIQLWCHSGIGFTPSSWQDLSGLGHNLVQATGANQPSLVASGGPNNDPEVLFNGSTQFMQAAFTLAQPWTCFITYKQLTFTAVSVHDVVMDGATNATSVITSSSSAGHLWSMYAGTEVDSGAQRANGVYACATLIWNGASSVARINGVQVIAANIGAGTPGGVTVGALALGGRACNIKVREIAVASGALSAADIARMENYMRAGVY